MKPTEDGPKGKPRGRIIPKTMTKLERQELAVQLRREGYTYREIARLIRTTDKVAYQLVADAFKNQQLRTKEQVEQLTELHSQRLDWMFLKLKDRIGNGDTRAIEVATKLLDRQAKLLGLDAPVKQQVNVRYEQMSDQELAEEAQRVRVLLPSLNASNLLLPGETALPAALEEELRQVVDAEYVVKDAPTNSNPAPSAADRDPQGP